MTPEFWLTSLVVVLVPGTGVIFTVSSTLARGWSQGVWAALGCTLGIVPHLAISLLGLSMVLHSFALAFVVLKWVGAAYLGFLAWQLWTTPALRPESGPSPTVSGFGTLRKALLMNLLNPKLTLFFLAFLPLFVTPGTNPSVQMVILGLAFMALTLVVFLAYGLVAYALGEVLVRHPRSLVILNRIFAGLLVVFAVQIVATKE